MKVEKYLHVTVREYSYDFDFDENKEDKFEKISTHINKEKISHIDEISRSKGLFRIWVEGESYETVDLSQNQISEVLNEIMR